MFFWYLSFLWLFKFPWSPWKYCSGSLENWFRETTLLENNNIKKNIFQKNKNSTSINISYWSNICNIALAAPNRNKRKVVILFIFIIKHSLYLWRCSEQFINSTCIFCFFSARFWNKFHRKVLLLLCAMCSSSGYRPVRLGALIWLLQWARFSGPTGFNFMCLWFYGIKKFYSYCATIWFLLKVTIGRGLFQIVIMLIIKHFLGTKFLVIENLPCHWIIFSLFYLLLLKGGYPIYRVQWIEINCFGLAILDKKLAT